MAYSAIVDVTPATPISGQPDRIASAIMGSKAADTAGAVTIHTAGNFSADPLPAPGEVLGVDITDTSIQVPQTIIDHAGVLQVPAPAAAPVLSSAAGGTLAAATYFVKYTFNGTPFSGVTGETTPSPEATLAVALNNLLVIPAPVSPPAGAQSWNAYVTNGASGTETLQQSGISLGSSWTEPTTGLVAGRVVPTSNTAVFPQVKTKATNNPTVATHKTAFA